MTGINWVCLLALCTALLLPLHVAFGQRPAEYAGIRGESPQPMMTVQVQEEAGGAGSGEIKSLEKELIDVKLYDLELTDQDGNKLNFKNDVIGDRVAVIIPFYTTCTTAYPILVFMLTRVQETLGEHLGKDVVLVSVSVDPRTDIPIRLKAYARRQKAKPGWLFLSGDRNNLGQVLLGVGVLYSPNIEEHNHIPITLVGSARGEWRRYHGFPSPDQIMAEINRSLSSRK